jgi:hypothetical protein
VVGDRGGGGEAGSAGLCCQHGRCSTVYNLSMSQNKINFPGSRVLMAKNCKKFTAGNFLIFLTKNCTYLSLGLHKGRPSYKKKSSSSIFIPQKRTSSTSKLDISSPLWVIFALLHPNPDHRPK